MDRLPDARPAPPADLVGGETLDIFRASPAYNRFLWRSLNALGPVRGKVLEVGCGIGNLTRLILEEPDIAGVHGIDPDPVYVERLRASIPDSRLTVSVAALEDFESPRHAAAAGGSFDRIVASNVVEHIEDDEAALASFHRLLRPGGEALILVPAHRWLYCGLDRNLSHYRRYGARDLDRLARASGLRLVRRRHFNPVGVLGWWLNGCLLRRSVLPRAQVTAYSRFAVPLSVLADRLNPLPVGISLLALYRKDGDSA